MILPDRLPTISIAVAVLAIVAFTGCGSGEKATDRSAPKSATTTSEKFASTPSSEWGPLAKCPIRPQSADPGGTPSRGPIAGVLEFGKQSRDHVESCVNYAVHPAVGGALRANSSHLAR